MTFDAWYTMYIRKHARALVYHELAQLPPALEKMLNEAWQAGYEAGSGSGSHTTDTSPPRIITHDHPTDTKQV